MSFIDSFNSLYNNFNSDDNDTSESTTCVTEIDHQRFHTFLLIPSSLMILLLAFTIPRKNKKLDCFYGRPGAVFPMDILGKSHRFSYAAAWGSIAFLAAELVFDQKFALQLSGPPIVTALNAVLSMLIYGIDYFPLFAALALESVFGYLVGTVYAWMFLGITIFKSTECDYAYQARLILILRDIPSYLCLGYLSISLPIRTVQALRGKTMKLLSASEMVSILNTTKALGKTPEGNHCKKLLRPPPPPPPEPGNLADKLKLLIRNFIREWVYHRRSSFRYSARIMSVMLIGVILLYKVTLELMVFVLSILTLIQRGFDATLYVIGLVPEQGEESVVTKAREGVFLMYYLLLAGRACFITALSVACFSGLLTILHMMTTYRVNLYELYKGKSEIIPPRNTRSNPSLLVGAMKYAGYQVGYIAWGFFIHFLILFIVAAVIATVITFIKEGYYQWLLDILANAWPGLMMTIIFLVVQTLSAKLLFLQGDDLALDNRRFLFTFTFFMFFYNIFIGLVSCLMRIIKSIVIGAIFLPRLDHSALPRRFQMMDPGFAAYVGFIHVECAHTHPVLVVFLRLMIMDFRARKTGIDPRDTTAVNINGSGIKAIFFRKRVKVKREAKKKPDWGPRVSTRARTRWFLMYTLYSNPELRTQRKQYIQYVKMLRERLARHYNMNKSAMGALVKGMNKTVTPMGIQGGGASTPSTGPTRAQSNWNAMLGMSRFMMAMQQNRSQSNGPMDIELAMLEMSNAMIDEAEGLEGGVQGETKEPEVSVDNSKPSLWKKAAFGALKSGFSNTGYNNQEGYIEPEKSTQL